MVFLINKGEFGQAIQVLPPSGYLKSSYILFNSFCLTAEVRWLVYVQYSLESSKHILCFYLCSRYWGILLDNSTYNMIHNSLMRIFASTFTLPPPQVPAGRGQGMEKLSRSRLVRKRAAPCPVPFLLPAPKLGLSKRYVVRTEYGSWTASLIYDDIYQHWQED